MSIKLLILNAKNFENPDKKVDETNRNNNFRYKIIILGYIMVERMYCYNILLQVASGRHYLTLPDNIWVSIFPYVLSILSFKAKKQQDNVFPGIVNKTTQKTIHSKCE